MSPNFDAESASSGAEMMDADQIESIKAIEKLTGGNFDVRELTVDLS